jgi:hypothetical protein
MVISLARAPSRVWRLNSFLLLHIGRGLFHECRLSAIHEGRRPVQKRMASHEDLHTAAIRIIARTTALLEKENWNAQSDPSENRTRQTKKLTD